MDPNTVNAILFAEQIAALAAKTIADIASLVKGNSTKSTADIIADADASYQTIINGAK